MKSERQKKILEMIEEFDIDTQEELIARLERAGYAATQATISRDIRELKLVKSMTPKGAYKYSRPGTRDMTVPRFNSAVAGSIIHVDHAGNLVVIRTYPGMAQPVASCIDSIGSEEILGCVGGDDTVLVAIRHAEKSREMCDKIRDLLHTM